MKRRAPAYLLDTNVISETRKQRPNSNVMRFIASMGSPLIFISALSFGELHRGAILLSQRDREKAECLLLWIRELQVLSHEHTLPVDLRVAELWGVLSSDRSRPPIDTLLAATAIVHGLTLVTRNTQDVDDLPLTLLNPWDL